YVIVSVRRVLDIIIDEHGFLVGPQPAPDVNVTFQPGNGFLGQALYLQVAIGRTKGIAEVFTIHQGIAAADEMFGLDIQQPIGAETCSGDVHAVGDDFDPARDVGDCTRRNVRRTGND